MFRPKIKRNMLIIWAAMILMFAGFILIVDDIYWHWIGYFGPDTGNPFIDNVLLEHWLYGLIMLIIGVLLIAPEIVKR